MIVGALSWADLLWIARTWLLLAGIAWIQLEVVDPAFRGGRVGTLVRAVIHASAIPVIALSGWPSNQSTPLVVGIVGAGLWLAGIGAAFVLGRRDAAASRAQRGKGAGGVGDPADLAPGAIVAWEQPGPVSPSATVRAALARTSRRSVALALALGIVLVAPGAIVVATTTTVCERAEQLLATRVPIGAGSGADDPSAFLARSGPRGEAVTVHEIDLGHAAAERRNPLESLAELLQDGFVREAAIDWTGRDGLPGGAFAQTFRSAAGALAFDSFATRYACQFSNVAFVGPRGGIGLQIRYAAPPPISEQVSWIRGTTRVVVGVSFVAVPPDHAALAAAVSIAP